MRTTTDRSAAPYVSTYLGNRFYPLEPRIADIAIEDIAHGLAFQCRFNGQTRVFYSVAQHSVLVARIVPPALRLEALLHDAAEAYLGDMVKPLKNLFPEFAALENRVMQAIGAAFGIAAEPAAAIKRADLVLLATEKRDLLPHSSERWDSLAGIEPLPQKIHPWSPTDAKAWFLDSFRKLLRERADARQPGRHALPPTPLHRADGVAGPTLVRLRRVAP